MDTSTIEDLQNDSRSLLQEMPVLEQKFQQYEALKSLSPEDVLLEVLKFITLISKYNVRLSPSQNVDYAWHEFILCTKLYHSYCFRRFNRYIHHTPSGDKKINYKNFVRTLKLIELEFGSINKLLWGVPYIENESSCGSCESS